MASNTAADLPPEAIAFASRMYDAARAGQALPAGLPANMTNEKGDSLVGTSALAPLPSHEAVVARFGHVES
jgi:hypothetical protein